MRAVGAAMPAAVPRRAAANEQGRAQPGFLDFERTVTQFEAHLHALRELERQTAVIVDELKVCMPALLSVTQTLRRNARDLEVELYEAAGDKDLGEAAGDTGADSPQSAARLARAASSLERVMELPHASAHEVVVEAEALHKCAHDEVYSRVAAARQHYNGICCPLLTVLSVENVRRRVFAHIPGASSSRRKPRKTKPLTSSNSMRDLARCRGICRAFRRWLDSALTSVPRVVVAGGAMLGDQTGGRAGPQKTVECLDLVSLKWSKLRPMRAKRCGAGCSVLADGRLLVAGGKSSEHLLLRSVEAYNALTNDWEVLPDMSTPRYGCAAARLADGRALVIGGRGSNGFLATVEAYSPQLNIWGQVAKMREARYLFACAALADGRVLVAGGVNARSKHSPLASVEIFDPMAGPASGGTWPPGEWTAVSTMSIGREAAACTTMNDGRVVVMGGRGARRTHDHATGRTQPPPVARRDYLDSVEVYDPYTDRWSNNCAPELHSGRFGGASVSLGGMVILLGGADGHGELNRVESWDPLARQGSDHKHREWTTLAPMGECVGRVMAAVSSVQFS
eukprot:COSAG02_NODE_394_length_23152_cov_13.232204_14_plen_568_part_00